MHDDVTLEYHYKFVVLLPLEADEKLEALKHYFGITYEGELITRGIETRRHDTPKFIKDFQRELLYTLFDANSTTEIIDRTLENALFCVTKTIDKVMTGEIDPARLDHFKATEDGYHKVQKYFSSCGGRHSTKQCQW